MTIPAIEVIVMSAITSETKKSGRIRKVTFLLPNDGDHPFAGMIGDRLHIVPVRINDDETSDRESAGQDGCRRAAISETAPPSERKKAWHELPPSQQAGMRCDDPGFWKFLSEIFGEEVTSHPQAKWFVHQHCDVTSRKDLDNNRELADRWQSLDTDYLVWSGKMADPR